MENPVSTTGLEHPSKLNVWINSLRHQPSQLMKGLSQRAMAGDSGDGLKRRLIKGATGSLGLRLLNTGLTYSTSILLARVLGTADYGTYVYVTTWVILLSIPATLGLDRLLIREIATYQAQASWPLMRGLFEWSRRTVVINATIVALFAAFLTWLLLAANPDPTILFTFWVGFITLPLNALRATRAAVMQGLQHVVTGQIPEMLIQPALLITLTGCAYWLLHGKLEAPHSMGVSVLAAVGSISIGEVFLRRVIPIDTQQATPAYRDHEWMQSALPMMMISGMYLIQNRTDALMLGAIQGNAAVGIYSVASRGAEFISFVLLAVNMSLGPAIAKLYAQGNLEKLQSLITKSSRMTLLLSLPVWLGFTVFGYWFLLLFGPDFVQGQRCLVILGFAQIINIGTGPVNLLLVMSGHQNNAAITVALTSLISVVLNAILIPQFGIEGAATATAISIALQNIILAVWVYKQLGIHTTAFGKLTWGRKAW